MSSDLEVNEKISWIPLILLAAFLSFLAIFSYRILKPAGSECYYNFGIISQATFVAVYPQLLLTLAYPFRKRLGLTANKLTYLYTVGLVSSFTLGFGFRDFCTLFARNKLYDTIGILNVWWEPPLNAINAMVMGGVPTDWIAWGPIVFVISLVYITFYFFGSSIIMIFRRLWLDVERIPFPLTLAGYELLKVVQAKGEKSYGGRRPFVIGVLLGFIFMVPIFMARTFSWFPDIYGWRSPDVIPCWAWSVPASSSIGGIIGLAHVSIDPIASSIFFLAPLNITFNVWFWTLVTFILEQVAFSMGYYTGVPSMGGSARLCCPSGAATTAPFYWPLIAAFGGFVSLTTMYILLHRRYVIETMRLAFYKRNPELEKNEAMNYRSMYGILILSAIMCIVSLMIMGIGFASAFLLMLFDCATTWFAMTMIFGMTSFSSPDLRIWAAGYLRFVWPNPSLAPANLDYEMSTFWAQMGPNEPTFAFGDGYFITAQSLKMASLTGTSNRNTFLVATVSFLVSIPIFWASSVWTANLYGSRVLELGFCALGDMCESNPVAQASRPNIFIYITYGTAGFLWTALLSYLHARFMWFPFEPIGFIIANSFGGQYQGVWSACLVAWIAKTIVFRVGGSALYEKIALPIVGGFITGVVLASTIGIITGMVRFYIPF